MYGRGGWKKQLDSRSKKILVKGKKLADSDKLNSRRSRSNSSLSKTFAGNPPGPSWRVRAVQGWKVKRPGKPYLEMMNWGRERERG